MLLDNVKDNGPFWINIYLVVEILIKTESSDTRIKKDQMSKLVMVG